jgi:hypothetical protein
LFCGRPAIHPYELLTAMEGIGHRTTKTRSPRTDGFMERMNRTLLDERFRVQGRTTSDTVQIQADLDKFLEFDNFKRSHQGYRLQGRSAAQASREALGFQKLPPFIVPPKADDEVQPEVA